MELKFKRIFSKENQNGILDSNSNMPKGLYEDTEWTCLYYNTIMWF
ncbi:hypothetical protein [Oceanirhabdus sp. W0125-5]|nr:hypothetical protein [Oceanirhabdus sp. W0125-5]WBW96903.1 hypothetical protein OW730_24915 [Oceanirhabdus sp. W0125-5]